MVSLFGTSNFTNEHFQSLLKEKGRKKEEKREIKNRKWKEKQVNRGMEENIEYESIFYNLLIIKKTRNKRNERKEEEGGRKCRKKIKKEKRR